MKIRYIQTMIFENVITRQEQIQWNRTSPNRITYRSRDCRRPAISQKNAPERDIFEIGLDEFHFSKKKPYQRYLTSASTTSPCLNFNYVLLGII